MAMGVDTMNDEILTSKYGSHENKIIAKHGFRTGLSVV
eukprot:SAG31_NODE_1041_length_10203_cov_1.922902_6_plen_37_part_01